MYVRPRPRFRPRNAGGVPFSPALLFTSGVAGAWYDPSDTSTLFQDSAGTTPVTAVEQPVGLMLDKSQGLATTAAAIDGNMNTATWTKGTGWSAPNARSLVCDGSQTGSSDTSASFTKSASTIVKWTFNITAISGTLSVYPTGGAPQAFTTTGIKTVYSDTASNFNIFRINGAGQTCTITDIAIQVVAGNYASQATAASRPVLRARYNLLTYSEQFDNAGWTKGNSTVTANQTTAPDGTTTADLVYPASSGVSRGVYQRPTLSSGTFVTTIYAKVAGKSWVAFVDYGGAAACAWANLSTGAVGTVNAGYSLSVTSAGSGWYRLQFTQTAAVANPYIWLTIVDSDNTSTVTANGTDGIYVWGADLRTGSSAGTYQRIAAATDYATVGFLPYLYFVTDDSFGTNSIDFTATDKMSVCAGVTKLSDAAVGIIAELSTSAGGGTSGTFVLHTQTSPVGYRYAAGSGFSGAAFATDDASTFTAPITNVITGISNFAGATINDEISVRVNGATPTQSIAGTVSTGNFGNYPLYIGRRGGASLPFNGNLYQLIVCGKTLSASELASTEAYVNSKTGAY